ncbi:T9SS type A sorting domain-containing protein [Hymenobacter sp. BT175]|uniref:T9SS type A sorting domain-containing protein n=1 Tax=Hymenobacter translucens TaxID=2886507 RepID=UPI001D0DC28E|nr:T9SS type A sorting domain-containing protein [Hymenobacter translucens]MCC2545802.1 T9SS type A sorting domain-containing protein [Hymenobacter translucens]
MKLLVLLPALLGAALLTAPAQAQAPKKPAAAPAAAKKPVPKPAVAKPAATVKPAAPAAPAAAATPAAPVPVALITEKMTPPAPSTDALKVSVDTNPVTNRLTVRTDAPGPTRVEVNDASGNPVLTRDTMKGNKPVVLDVSRVPAGTYLVRCTSGERIGVRRVVLGR